MKVIGNWGVEVTNATDLEYFKDQYGRSPGRFMQDFKLVCTARLGKSAFSPASKIRNIVFLEYDGTVNQLIHLEEGDRAYVYSDARLMSEGVFNSEQGAFLDLHTKHEEYRSFYFGSSPYCLNEGDDEWWDLHDQEGFDGVVSNMKERFSFLGEVSFQNTIFVRQL